MEKFSVKKPFTILVMVIIMIALGVQALTNMATDLLPEFSLPYMMVIAPYPGASPEKVETTVARPLESALGTVNGVKNVSSVSSENYALIQLEFQTGTDMNGALVRVNSALQEAESLLPTGTMTPTLMEISLDMVATMYTAVSDQDLDIYELSSYVEDRIIPYIERQDGVASVNPIGLIEQTIQVDLDQKKIDKLNDKILAQVNKALAEAQEQLDEAEAQVANGQAQLEYQQSLFGSTLSSGIFSQVDGTAESTAAALREQLAGLIARLREVEAALVQAQSDAQSAVDDPAGTITDSIAALRAQLESLISELETRQSEIDGSSLSALLTSVTNLIRSTAAVAPLMDAIQSAVSDTTVQTAIGNVLAQLSALDGTLASVPQIMDTLQTAVSGLTQAQLDAAVGFSTAASQLTSAQTQLQQARAQYEASRQQALSSANADALLNAQTLSQLIYAQNFSMPAGYIDDKDDNSWLLRVGQEFDDADVISGSLLADIEGVGSIRLEDVATVTVIDNLGDAYSKLNGSDGIVLCIYKASTAGTNEVSRACNKAFEELKAEDPSLNIVNLVDQGSYIQLIIGDILSSILLGAALAILVLVLFTHDIRPTLIVGISIPLSVMFALVLMYFSDLSLNMMTLSGLALGIGMLVDNSIVVMENTFRLKGQGLSAARAAVQGAKQVRGAILSSTITTVCVFLPMIFSDGYVKDFLIPMALSIGYCLAASLIIALTVIPASSSTIMKNMRPKDGRAFTWILDHYGRALGWCLKHKALPLAVAVALLAVTVVTVFRTGIILIPDINSPEIQISITTPETDTKEESFARVDKVMDGILKIDGVENIGIMDGASSTSFLGSFGGGGSSDSYGFYIAYGKAGDDAEKAELNRICEEITALQDESGCTITASSGSMTELTSFMASSDLTMNLYGKDAETLEKISEEAVAWINNREGFTNASNGLQNGDPTLHLVIDKDKAMSYGLTVAQIYGEISSRLTTSVTSTTITVDGVDMEVVIKDDTDPLLRENLMDMEFTAQSLGSTASSGMSGMSGMSGSSMADMAAMAGMSGMTGDTGTSGSGSGSGSDAAGAGDQKPHKLSEFATLEEELSPSTIRRENQSQYLTITADAEEGYNTTLLVRDMRDDLRAYNRTLPSGYSLEVAGETTQINDMVTEMLKALALALLFVYLVMVAQFQSLLSPFIILFTIPLAFTGGMFALMITGQQISMIAMMGFLILMGTVVNNGIVFVDFANQLRIGGMERREALIVTGKSRMRPILMTTLTTVLAMTKLMFGKDMGSQLGSGMAVVMTGGLLYATLMTLFIIPIMYDLLFRRKPMDVDVGDDLDEQYNEALLYLEDAGETSKPAAAPASAAAPVSAAATKARIRHERRKQLR
ncbi:MAG: efflux RND transporter permease subunit [Eubacterium sp.]|nr:efflux RND transporter permease subunit [Eubacterium sp.]